ncbi:MAG: Rid family hydrolase [Rhodospirillaceae bacterium]|nr:Rid family hydrolase [Rhodospirillaceae bacterium]
MAHFDNVISVNAELEKRFGMSYLIRSSGPTLHMAGILSADKNFEAYGVGDMAAQIQRIYQRMNGVLANAGCTLINVVSEISFTTDIQALAGASHVRDEIYRAAGAAPPVATAVQVSALYLPGAMLEIQATAELST